MCRGCKRQVHGRAGPRVEGGILSRKRCGCGMYIDRREFGGRRRRSGNARIITGNWCDSSVLYCT